MIISIYVIMHEKLKIHDEIEGSFVHYPGSRIGKSEAEEREEHSGFLRSERVDQAVPGPKRSHTGSDNGPPDQMAPALYKSQ